MPLCVVRAQVASSHRLWVRVVLKGSSGGMIKSKWYVWLLASIPGVGVVIAAVSGVLDTHYPHSRASIVLLGLTVTSALLAVLAIASRPWDVAGLWRRVLALGGTGLAIVAAVGFGSMAIGTVQEEVFATTVLGVRSVAVDESGIVAVGNDNAGSVAVWLSQDGESWTRAEHSEAFTDVDARDVTVFGRQVLIVGQANETSEGVILASTDGSSWSLSPIFGPNLDPEAGVEMTRLLDDLATSAAWKPRAITDADGSLALVGDTYGNAAVFWDSGDGLMWGLADPLPVFDTGNELVDVVGWVQGFVAVGVDSDGDPQVWTSETGVKWTNRDTRMKGRDPLVAATSDLAVIVERTDNGTVVWGSDDGEAWTPYDTGEFVGVAVDAITSSDSGFAAVGVESNGRTALWVSADGTSWTMAAGDLQADNSEVNGIVALGASFLAFGYDRGTDTAAFWIIDEQSGWRRIAIDPAVASLG